MMASSAADAQVIIGTGTRNGELTPTSTTANNAAFGSSWVASGVSAGGNTSSGYAILDNGGDTVRTTAFTLGNTGSLALTFIMRTVQSGTGGIVVQLLTSAGNAIAAFPAVSRSYADQVNWGNGSVNFANVAAGSYILQFTRNSNADTALDNVNLTFTPVPAPLAGAGLLSMAFAGAGLMFRRRFPKHSIG